MCDTLLLKVYDAIYSVMFLLLLLRNKLHFVILYHSRIRT